MAEDRLKVLDIGVAVEAATRPRAPFKGGDTQTIAVCEQNRVVAIANGRFVDLYGACNNSLRPLAFQHQISLGDYVKHLSRATTGRKWSNDNQELCIATATCLAFPVPGFLLVGTFLEAMESEIEEEAGTGAAYGATMLLGFRLYAGSVSQTVGGSDCANSRKAAASVQVHFSFVEPVVGASVQGIRSLVPCQREMTADKGSIFVLFEDSEEFGVFCWRERFSDRQICLAKIKQQSGNFVTADCSSDCRYIIVGDTEGRLSLLDFQWFAWDDYEIRSISRGKRLEIGPCSRAGVRIRDNPLERVRLVHCTGSASCAYSSICWWVCGVRGQQKHFILAGKQDGSLNVRHNNLVSVE
ncbi:unnamed protein product [Phytophthora lilii]|uniref:Unnamed protein product n=1 Tax=Phytophthora lilii TaxID=2077276 RepID=A0A9W6TVN2_9STRA|nr:unnamed protein product [Phytophthora lilii]